MKIKDHRGFTLIELLAVILLIAVIAGISVYTAINVIGKAKEKTYKITIKNIEGNADSYLEERGDTLFFVDSGDGETSYQCVTVQNLIDYGYLKNDIVKSKITSNDKVLKTDYIYVEKNIQNNAITKVIYLGNSKYLEENNTEYAKICKVVMAAKASISFVGKPALSKWSKEKDINITYKINSSFVYSGEYQYLYSYSGEYTELKNDGPEKKIKVTSEGVLKAWIKTKDGIIYEKEETIKIDTTPPTIKTSSTQTLKASSQTLTIECNDAVNTKGYYFGTSRPVQTSSFSSDGKNKTMKITKTINEPGTYYMACVDNLGNMSEVKSVTYYKYTVDNKLETATGSAGTYNEINYTTVSKATYLAPSGTTLTLANIYTKPDYTNVDRFKGVTVGGGTISNNAPVLNTDNQTYTMWFNRNRVILKYKPGSDGAVTSSTKSSDGKETYTWSVDSSTGYIKMSKNGGTASVISSSLKYGYNSLNLANYNNKNYLNITRSGYSGKSGAQWKCVSGCKDSGKTFSHDEITINATDICTDDTLKSNDCNVVIEVNWQKNAPSGGGGGEPCYYCSCGFCPVSPPPTPSCFLGGTKVLTPDGQKNIEDLRSDDYIYSYNEENATVEVDKIKENISSLSYDDIYTIYTGDVSVSVTARHPFYVKDRGWVEVKDLTEDDVLLNNLGQKIKIERIKVDKNDAGVIVYNLSVLSNHNYFAGINSILVHNKGPSICFPAGTKVMTMTGYKNIEQIRFGEMVLTYNTKLGINEYQPVQKLWVRNTDRNKIQLHTLIFDDNSSIKPTANHKFYIKRGNQLSWIMAENIMIGDYVRYANGKWHKVTSNTYEITTDTVYTLLVANTHNFYAGEKQVLVHNATQVTHNASAS